MKKIRICSIDEDGRYGGPQARVLEIEKYIDKRKFNIDYIIPRNKKIFEGKLNNTNAFFTKIDLTRLSKNFYDFFNYIYSFIPEILYLIRFFKRNKFNLIQANGVTHLKSILAAKFAKIKSIWIIEDSYSPKIIVLLFRFLAKFTN